MHKRLLSAPLPQLSNRDKRTLSEAGISLTKRCPMNGNLERISLRTLGSSPKKKRAKIPAAAPKPPRVMPLSCCQYYIPRVFRGLRLLRPDCGLGAASAARWGWGERTVSRQTSKSYQQHLAGSYTYSLLASIHLYPSQHPARHTLVRKARHRCGSLV